MAPATPRSSAVTGVPSPRVASTIRPSRARRSNRSVGQGQHGHDLGADGDHELGLARDAVLTPTQADDHVAQGPVADVHDARPQDPVRVDAVRVLVVEAVVDERAGQVVRRPDGVHVTGQVQVEVLHRDDLAVAATGGPALDPEHRPERRLADAHRGSLADVVEALAQPDGRGRLALAQGRRRDGRHDHVLAARPLRLEALDGGERDLGLGRAVQLQLVVGDAQFAGDVDDRARRDGAGDVQVGREAHRTPRCDVAGGRNGAGRRRQPTVVDTRPAAACRCAARTRWVRSRALVRRADPTRDRRDGRGDGGRGLEVDIADEPAIDHVDADVHDHRAGLEHGPGDEARVPGGDDHDVGASDVRGQVARPRVADRDRGVLLDQQEGGGHAHHGRATDDHGLATLDLDARAAQDLDRGMGRRRQEAVVAEAQQTGVERVDAVDVLGRIDGVDDRAQADRRRAGASGR